MSTTTTLLNSLTQDLLTHNTSTPSPPQQTIKLEDIQNSPMPQTPPSSGTMPGSLSKPPTSHPKDQKTQPKKRKSWGQALPEPKTNLPPRKRAKTEDEKEQRRIERVKRNRLAAHNSRERKRQEVDELRDERDHLARENSALREIIAKYAQVGVKIELTDSQQNVLDSTETADWMTMNPRKASYDTSGPESSPSLGSIESPTDTTSQPATPAMMSIPEPDLTQHSAAMLCDLQCQSELSNWHLHLASLATTTFLRWTQSSATSLSSRTISSTFPRMTTAPLTL
ncbi:hypothetical protein EJ05DRAFT_483773 [Pseudovirgaria hyperparasitica]|uniref:BZIP domain-containing protein n=1 Tax=Pseudovirgaria hyperparasitica TaxID=470096 RepID=A0A6A6WH40_9PEZI|nr:uncharacterized protein EJ05DRAFT_483773 [Pseudovirgaria hyperparasitica]KAF2761405.1 hypothetical protein EJ05DRAFT_483773 [Pseudovirgaria hyperparasitica]